MYVNLRKTVPAQKSSNLARKASSAIPSKAFTLLEIILVIALVSMIAGVVGWQINSCLNRYAFAREVEEVYGTLQQAQVLALTYRTDIDVHFFQREGVWHYTLQTDEPFIEIPFDRDPKALKKVHTLTSNHKPVTRYDCTLFAQGTLEPRGVLGFKSAKESIWIDIQEGFHLALSRQKPALVKALTPAFPEDKLKKEKKLP